MPHARDNVAIGASRPHASMERQYTSWAAYAAAVWAFLFAALSFWWAVAASLGRGANADIVAHSFVALARDRDPGFIATLWLSVFLKVVGGLFALSLVRSWGRVLPARWRRGLAWGGGVALALYGVANLVQHGMMQAGLIDTPSGLGERALHWHLLVWDPFWLLGGILYLFAAHRLRAPLAEE